MPSKQVIDLHRIAASVTAGALHNRQRVNEAVMARLEEDGVLEALSTELPPEPPAETLEALTETAGEAVVQSHAAQLEAAPEAVPDVDRLQRFAAWAIPYYAEKMMRLDDLHQQERQQDWVARAKRDEAADTAYREYVTVRQMMTAALAPETVSSILGLEGDTPRNPFVLRDKLRFAIERMSSPETFFPDVRIAGLVQDWSELVERLSAALEPLDAALRELEMEAKAADTALLDKQKAIRKYRSAFGAWATILRGVYALAGEPELARRLSPTVIRRTSSDDETPPEGEDLPDEDELPGAGPAPEDGGPEEEPDVEAEDGEPSPA